MSITNKARPVVLGAVVVAAVAAFGWSAWHGQPASAAGSTPDMAIAIDVNGGGDDCDTRASTAGIGTTCSVALSSMFTLNGNVDSFTGISGTGGYGGFHFLFTHSAGLTLNQRAGTGEFGSPFFWPACASPSETKPAMGYEPVCHSAGPTSTYTGKVVEADYTCSMAGMQTITMVDSTTFLYNSSHAPDNSDKEGDEVLTINCVSASVGGIAELPGADGPATAAPEHASSPSTPAILAGAAAACLVALLGAGTWRLRRQRAR